MCHVFRCDRNVALHPRGYRILGRHVGTAALEWTPTDFRRSASPARRIDSKPLRYRLWILHLREAGPRYERQGLSCQFQRPRIAGSEVSGFARRAMRKTDDD